MLVADSLVPIWYLAIRNHYDGEGISMRLRHYNDVIMGAITSQITSLIIVYSTVYSDADQRKHQSSASLAFVRGIHRGPVNSPHKWPITRKMFPFDDVIMEYPNVRASVVAIHSQLGHMHCIPRKILHTVLVPVKQPRRI